MKHIIRHIFFIFSQPKINWYNFSCQIVVKTRFRGVVKESKKSANGVFTDFSLAGAEGIEPSARGFGDRCSTS